MALSNNRLIVLKWGTYLSSHLARVHLHTCTYTPRVCNTQATNDGLTPSRPSAANMQPMAELELSRRAFVDDRDNSCISGALTECQVLL